MSLWDRIKKNYGKIVIVLGTVAAVGACWYFEAPTYLAKSRVEAQLLAKPKKFRAEANERNASSERYSTKRYKRYVDDAQFKHDQDWAAKRAKMGWSEYITTRKPELKLKKYLGYRQFSALELKGGAIADGTKYYTTPVYGGVVGLGAAALAATSLWDRIKKNYGKVLIVLSTVAVAAGCWFFAAPTYLAESDVAARVARGHDFAYCANKENHKWENDPAVKSRLDVYNGHLRRAQAQHDKEWAYKVSKMDTWKPTWLLNRSKPALDPLDYDIKGPYDVTADGLKEQAIAERTDYHNKRVYGGVVGLGAAALAATSYFSGTKSEEKPVVSEPTPIVHDSPSQRPQSTLAQKRLAEQQERLERATQVKDAAEAEKAKEEQSGGIGLWWILIIAAVLAVVGAIVYFFCMSSEEEDLEACEEC